MKELQFSTEQFANIANKADQKQKRNELNYLLGTSGKKFDYFVDATIAWFYGDSDKNITVINDLLVIAHQSRGYNVQRLSAYLQVVIPHKLQTVKNLKECPKFLKKDKDLGYASESKWTSFCERNIWSQYGKPQDMKDFNAEATVKQFIAKLIKNEADEALITQAQGMLKLVA